MNKLFTKIATLALGATMAVGVGVAVASNAKEPTKVEAASQQWELVTSAPSDWSGEYILCNGTSGSVKYLKGSTFDSSSAEGADATVTSSKITVDDSNALTIAKSSTSGKYTVKVNGKYIGKNANSNGIDSSTTWSSDLDNEITYSSSKVVIKGNGGRVLTWYASNSNFRYYASSNNNSQLFKKVAGGTSYAISTTVTNGSSTGDTSISEGGTATVTITPSTGYKLPSTVSVSGATQSYDSSTGVVSLSNPTGAVTISAECVVATSYNITVSATNCTYTGPSTIYEGNTATITFTANSGYELPASVTPTGASVKSWTPSTGALVLENPTGAVSVSVTAAEKENLGGLTDGRFFLIVGGHVLKAGTFAAKGADDYTTSSSSTEGLSESDAWYFSSTATDDTWNIRVSNAANANYLYATNTNNGLVSGGTSDSWTVEEGTGTYAGKLVMKDTTNNRYISYTTSSGSYVRVYTSTGTGNCEVSFVKYTPSVNHTVSFNANGGSGSMQDVETSGTYTLPACDFTAPSGQAFAGWKAENIGSLIAAGDTYSVTTDVEFYAQWAAQRTLTYNANGGSGTMTDPNSPYGDGATVTVLSNTFGAPSGMRFSHWNTESDDTGTTYAANDTFTIGADVTLYAIWEDSPVVITSEEIASFSSSYSEYDWTYGTGATAISGKIKAFKNGDNIQMNHNNTCYIYNTIAIPGYITGITFTKVSGTTDLTAWVGDEVLSSDPESGGETNTTYSWTFDPADHHSYFRVATSGSTGARVASAITITYQKVSLVDPTSITLDDASAISMDTYGYGKRTLSATVGPFNANDKTVTWGTNNSSVVTVANGVLTPVGTGTTTIYACTANYDPLDPNPDLIKTVSVTVYQAEYRKATFVPTSVSAANQTDDYLSGGSVVVSATTAGSYNSDKAAIQIGQGKDSTFTISGYANMQIIGIDLVMSSNANAGTGSLLVTAGSTEIFEIETAPFSDSSWNGAFDANPVHLYKDCTDYVVQDNETIKFEFAATINSLYIHSVSIRYLDYSLESWCEDFLTELTGGEDPICKGYGITDTTKLEEAWTDLGARYLVEVSDDVKYIIEGATADESGTAIERAAALYDWCVTHYSASICDRFIDRASNGSGLVTNNNTILPAVNSETSIAIIVVISIVSVSAIGGYFFLRKRKETN